LLEHGGRLRQAAKQYDIELSQWLDLSTGLNPNAWPVPAIDSRHWARLPEDDDGLVAAAQSYYGCEQVLPVAGTQAAIQLLPALRLRFSGSLAANQQKIGLIHPSYAEHAHVWHQAGFEVLALNSEEIAAQLPQLSCLVLVNPNNPTGETVSPQQLLAWHAQLAQQGGWLVVDEAFMDCTPELSLCAHASLPGLIVLRSLGKFFGLAGARVGFVMAQYELLHTLQEMLGPWTVNGPARQVAKQALLDTAWHDSTRQTLPIQSQRLQGLLQNALLLSTSLLDSPLHDVSRQNVLHPTNGTALFQWIRTPHAETVRTQLAQQGIWIRLFEQPASLRFGLPANEAQWMRLQRALQSLLLSSPQAEAV